MENVLNNVCPNCGGGFEKRPTRPADCMTGNCTDKHPVSEKVVYKPVDFEKFNAVRQHFENVHPQDR